LPRLAILVTRGSSILLSLEAALIPLPTRIYQYISLPRNARSRYIPILVIGPDLTLLYTSSKSPLSDLKDTLDRLSSSLSLRIKIISASNTLVHLYCRLYISYSSGGYKGLLKIAIEGPLSRI
jgi:hypothetical protein